jgi:hypothetical protein
VQNGLQVHWSCLHLPIYDGDDDLIDGDDDLNDGDDDVDDSDDSGSV